jgi:hypothetical protein
MAWNERAISKPPVLHTTVPLELGDLYINQFYSTHHQARVLQVWLLVTESGNDTWKQVRDKVISCCVIMPNPGNKDR